VSKLKLPVYMICCTIISSLITNLGFLFFPSSSVAKDVYGSEIHYRSCAQLQKQLNDRNNPSIKFKGFEGAELARRSLAEEARMFYCNDGIIIDKEEKTVCRGYIGYAFFPKMGIASYYGDWGWTNGTPNFNDDNKADYCRRLK
jgi:hypothetical protein